MSKSMMRLTISREGKTLVELNGTWAEVPAGAAVRMSVWAPGICVGVEDGHLFLPGGVRKRLYPCQIVEVWPHRYGTISQEKPAEAVLAYSVKGEITLGITPLAGVHDVPTEEVDPEDWDLSFGCRDALARHSNCGG